MKTLENDLVLTLYSCLQIDEDSRRGWAARSAPQLAQRFKQLAPESCTDVSKIISCLQRRRRPLCWCLLLLGGRVDVQLHAAAELFVQCVEPTEGAFLQQCAAQLTRQQQHCIQQRRQQQILLYSQQTLGQFPDGKVCDDVAVTPSLLPDDGIGSVGAHDGDVVGEGTFSSDGGSLSKPSEALQYSIERLATLLSCVAHDPECMDLICYLALRRNSASLTCLIRMLTPAQLLTPPSALSMAAAAAGTGGSGFGVAGVQIANSHGPINPLAKHAARALSYLAAYSEVRAQLLALGAVTPFLTCLSVVTVVHQQQQQHQEQFTQQQLQLQKQQQEQCQQIAADVAKCLAQLSSFEAAGREMLRVQGPGGIQALIALVNGTAGAAAVEPAVQAIAALTAHPTLRPGLVAAGATEALMTLVELSGGPILAAWAPNPPARRGPRQHTGAGGGPSGTAAATLSGEPYLTMELALLALVRCIRTYGGGGGGGGGGSSVASTANATGSPSMGPAQGSAGTASTTTTTTGSGNSAPNICEIPASVLQLLLDVAAMQVRPQAVLQGEQVQQQQQQSLPMSPTSTRGFVDGDDSGHAQPQPPPIAMAVIEATEALADMAREVSGASRVVAFGGHLVLLQRLLAEMPATSTATASSSAQPAGQMSRRQLDACLRGLARLAMASPSHPELRLARTHEVLLHVLLGLGLADRPGWWALQGLCALAADASCASELVPAGVLPPVVAALRGLAAAQSPQRSGSPKRRRGFNTGVLVPPPPPQPQPRAHGLKVPGVGSAGAASNERDIEVAHLLGLLLQNLAGHKALARVAVAEGAVSAICEWLAVCVGSDDVEGAVLCCATLCLLGDGDPGALVDMVHSDGIDMLVELLHPRWATASLVPSTVAAAIAVACRWPASAQAVRMASGIPALADTLRGPHGLACCRPVVSALVDLIANDPPALRAIRTTNTVIGLGTQLQLLPNNDPRAARIRLLLRQLGEDPDTAMRLANSEADNAIATAAAAPHHQHHHLNQHHHQHQHAHHRAGARHPNASAVRLQLEAAAAAACGGGGGGSWRWRFARSSESGPEGSQSALTEAVTALGSSRRIGSGGRRSFRASSPGAIVPVEGPPGVRWRLGEGPSAALRDDLACVLAALRGESSYKSLRRASLKQLAKRMDASDFSDVEDDVEDYMAVLEVASRDQASGTSISRASSVARRMVAASGNNNPQLPAAAAASTASSAHSATRTVRGAFGDGSVAASVTWASTDAGPGVGDADALLKPPSGNAAASLTLSSRPPSSLASSVICGITKEKGNSDVVSSKPSDRSNVIKCASSRLSVALQPSTVSAVFHSSGERSMEHMVEVEGATVVAGPLIVSRDTTAAAEAAPPPQLCDGRSQDSDASPVIRHRYSIGGGSTSSHGLQGASLSVDEVPESVDFWLATDDPDEGSAKYELPAANHDNGQRVELAPLQPANRQDPNREWCGSGAECKPQHEYQHPRYHPASYQPQLQSQPQAHQHCQGPDSQPMGRRGRNAVAHTLAAVNPLRLFGVVRRGPHRKAGDVPGSGDFGAGGAGGGGGVGEGPAVRWDSRGAPLRTAGGRRSLQVDGEELVYWSTHEADY